jgi:hypothetical protein
MNQPNIAPTDSTTAAAEATISAGLEWLEHHSDQASYHRAHLSKLVRESHSDITNAVTVALDQLEANGRSAVHDLLASQRECRLLAVKLDSTNRTIRWLRAQLTAKGNDSAQVIGGTN